MKYSIAPLLICFAMFIRCHGVTDDIKNNDGQTTNTDIFKLKKYNAIWTRATARNLAQDKLDSLKRILKKLDRQDIDLKHSGVNIKKDRDRQTFFKRSFARIWII